MGAAGAGQVRFISSDRQGPQESRSPSLLYCLGAGGLQMAGLSVATAYGIMVLTWPGPGDGGNRAHRLRYEVSVEPGEESQ